MHAASSSAAETPAMARRALPAMGARRRLIIGGILLVLAGMILGDIFAVFVLHPNANRIGERLFAATEAVAAGDSTAAGNVVAQIGGLLENRGTKVDSHVHIIVFGYVALLLALLQPYVALSAKRQTQFATLFLAGSALLPISVFLIHYVGLVYSPLQSIGWASIFADFGGFLVIVACVGELSGLGKYLRGRREAVKTEELLIERGWACRALLSGGTLLVLAGFLHGAYYAGVYRSEHERRDVALLRNMVSHASANDRTATAAAVNQYGALQAERAVHVAAHAHIIEFGILALLLAFIQPYVFLSERWKRRWAVVLLLGSLALPVFVLLELQWGLVAGGLADVGGLLVIIALMGMLIGVIRYTGKLDAEAA
jgi:hypothetical protein